MKRPPKRRYSLAGRRRRSTRIRETSGNALYPPWSRVFGRWKQDIEEFVLSILDPALYQDGLKIGLLEELNFIMEVHNHRLLLTFHLKSKSVRRKITGVYRLGSECLELEAEHLNQLERFEIRPASDSAPLKFFETSRKKFQKFLEGLIARNFPKAKIIRSTLHSDLEHSLSGKYVRLLFSSGRNHWAALAAGSLEDQATLDGILSNGLIWREHLRRQKTYPQMKLLLVVPKERGLVLISRLRWVRGAAKEIYLMEMNAENHSLTYVDLEDIGNVDTFLTQVNTLGPTHDLAQTSNFKQIIRLAPQDIEPVTRPGSNSVSFRIRGLEFAALYPGSGGELTFGVGKQRPLDTNSDWKEVKKLIDCILQERQAAPKSRYSLLYRLQAERWLESLILKDIQVIDTQLNPRYVYPQVPAFLGGDRGMIDILSVTNRGRLAVLELKVSADIELPFQGVDYWLRVRWHQFQEDFFHKGYFHNIELSADPPILYFVCPQFCYHDTFPLIVSSIHSSVPMVQVGINEDWRAGIQVVMRRTLH